MSKENENAAAMPRFYLTPAGRVVEANPALHRMVVEKKGSRGQFVPCNEKGVPEGAVEGQSAAAVRIQELEDQLHGLLEAGDKAYDTGVEAGKAEMAEQVDQLKADLEASAAEIANLKAELEAKPKGKPGPKTKAKAEAAPES